jgi:hypothetical protein
MTAILAAPNPDERYCRIRLFASGDDAQSTRWIRMVVPGIGNRMTGGGVTAGLDFALALIAEMRGEELARRVQLTIEYVPELCSKMAPE